MLWVSRWSENAMSVREKQMIKDALSVLNMLWGIKMKAVLIQRSFVVQTHVILEMVVYEVNVTRNQAIRSSQFVHSEKETIIGATVMIREFTHFLYVLLTTFTWKQDNSTESWHSRCRNAPHFLIHFNSVLLTNIVAPSAFASSNGTEQNAWWIRLTCTMSSERGPFVLPELFVYEGCFSWLISQSDYSLVCADSM